MKKKPAARKTPTTKPVATKLRSDSLAPLIAEVRSLVQSARRGVASVIDTFQVGAHELHVHIEAGGIR